MDPKERRRVGKRILEILSGRDFHSQSIIQSKDLLFKKLREIETGLVHARYLEIMWNLVSEGMVFLDPLGTMDFTGFEWAISEKGGRVLASEGEFEPDDPEGYLEALRTRIPGIDPTMLIYLREALNSYRGGNYMASTMMLGVASERSFQLVGEAFLKWPKAQLAGSFRKIFEKQGVAYSKKFEELRKALAPLKGDLPGAYRDTIDVTLASVWEFLRVDRNQVAHQQGAQIDPHTAYISLQTFARHTEILYALKNHFEGSGP